MPILPLQGPGQVLQAVAVARTAASVASVAFSKLLQAASAENSAQGQAGDARKAGGGGSPSRTAGRQPVDTSQAAEKLRTRTAELIESFHSQLSRLLAENGVDVSGGVTLSLDTLGSLRVESEHVDGPVIETVLAAHPKLGRVFRQIELNAQLLQLLDASASVGSGHGDTDAANTGSASGPLPAGTIPADGLALKLYLDGEQARVALVSKN